jgi:DNA-binding response OmpR family regulator
VKKRILLIGNDLSLQKTRVWLLSRWQTTTASSIEAETAIEESEYDLVILCQSVPEDRAQNLIARVQKLDSPPPILAVSGAVTARKLRVPTYQVQMDRPSGFLEAVAQMLDA